MKKYILILTGLLLFPLHALAEDRWDEEVIELIIQAHEHSNRIEGRLII